MNTPLQQLFMFLTRRLYRTSVIVEMIFNNLLGSDKIVFQVVELPCILSLVSCLICCIYQDCFSMQVIYYDQSCFDVNSLLSQQMIPSRWLSLSLYRYESILIYIIFLVTFSLWLVINRKTHSSISIKTNPNVIFCIEYFIFLQIFNRAVLFMLAANSIRT